MTAKAGRLRLVGALLVAALALAWWLRSGDGVAPSPDVAPGAPAVAGPRRISLRSPERSAIPAMGDPPSATSGASHESAPTISGRAVLPGDAPANGHVVVVDSDRRVVGSGAIDADGTFGVVVPAGVGDGLRVVVAVDGWRSQERPWSPGTGPLVVRVEDGLVLSGRVVLEERGTPLRGAELRLVDAFGGSASVPSRWTGDVEALAVGSSAFATARTDEEGAFTFRGLSPSEYTIVSASRSWFVETLGSGSGRVSLLTVATPVTLLARPAGRLRVEVVDATTSRPVPAFEGHLRDVTTGMFVAFGGEDGRLDVTFPRWWGGDEAISLDLDVDAKGYEPVRMPLRDDAGHADLEARVAAKPVAAEDVARVVFEIVDGAGKPIDARWRVRVVDPKDADKTLREVDVEVVDATHVRGDVAPGRWTFLVSTGEGLGFLRWIGECDVVRGSSTAIRCPMPAYGSLRVALPASRPGPDGGPFLSLHPSAGRGSRVDAPDDEYRAPALPEGDYELVYVGAAGTKRRLLRIRAGEETTVSFRDP